MVRTGLGYIGCTQGMVWCGQGVEKRGCSEDMVW